MRASLSLALAAAMVLVSGACQAPTKHTGKRPITSRRDSEFGADKTLEERLVEREERLGEVSARHGEAVDTETQLVGVGSTHRFHYDDCEKLQDVPRADRVLFVSIFDALDGGYHPCDTCNPGR